MPKSAKALFYMAVGIVTALSVVAVKPDIAAASEAAPGSAAKAVQLKHLKKQFHISHSAIRFWKDRERGRWMLHLRHNKCWNVQGKQRRTLCRLGREMLRFHKTRLDKLEFRIEKLTGPEWCGGLRGNRAIGCRMAYRIWPSEYEWNALEALWYYESKWDEHARNPSGACGIPQAMNKCSFGYDPVVQIRWGLRYILHRPQYGTPSRAYAFFRANNWY